MKPSIILTLVLFLSLSARGLDVGAQMPRPASAIFPPVLITSASRLAGDQLVAVMDKYHKSFDVYTDVAAGGNHFVHPARLTGVSALVTMTTSYTGTVHTGATAIQNTFTPLAQNGWGGWYLQNAVLTGTGPIPLSNWGEYANAGYDLTGATQLTFLARGAQGKSEFFAFGIGRNATTGAPINLSQYPYPDSSPKVTACGIIGQPGTPTICYTTLTANWQQYTIALTGTNLSYVLGGFGWVTNEPQNHGQGITFYLDDIQYNLPRLDKPRFLVSYETISSTVAFDNQFCNTAFTYDNALALIALTALGEQNRAKLLADAIVYAQQHDRYYSDGRLRNAYQSGDLISPPGWTPNGITGTVRMPGWWDGASQTWHEDGESLGTSTGNVAWALLGLLNYYERYGGVMYRDAALALGNWIEANTRDNRGAGGYTGGFTGEEHGATKLFWKSTEHNLDVYVAFERLYRLTGEAAWQMRAEHARSLVEAMWNEAAGHYWTGTLDDGVTVNVKPIPLDAQSWSLLAFGPNDRTRRAIHYATVHHAASWNGLDGFDFDDDQDMPWFEGTGQMAVAYTRLLRMSDYYHYQSELREVQTSAPNGNARGIVAAPADGLTTGLGWDYYNRLHIGATAWFIFAELEYNPYWQTMTYHANLPLISR
jgi:hypothetical protein